MAPTQKRRPTVERPKRIWKGDDRDVVLLCNPQAGGRWKELADILDSEEAGLARRIVTDSIEDVGPALSNLTRKTQLVCIYGGDGTIQHIIDKICENPKSYCPHLAFIGGGTMNVTARWCGLTRSAGKNFREIVRAYKSGQLLLKEVPLLKVQQDENVNWGFTFGLGPPIRLLNEYENGTKGKAAALRLVAKSMAAVWTEFPADFQPLLQEMEAEILMDGQKLPYEKFIAVFCNVTGRINRAVEPFVKQRARDTFYCAAYAVNRRELALAFPLLIRGRIPLDPKALLQSVSAWKKVVMSHLGKDSFPADPRYVNETAKTFEVRSKEKLYTVDGEILQSSGESISVSLGPELKLAVAPTVDLGRTMRLAANVTRPS
ncbi:MAG: diacylglycerol kinase family protein [Pseudomonadota bacterium]